MLNVKPRLAVHKFTSCDGCQLALLNAGDALLKLAELVDFVHFVEAGVIDLDAKVDITFIEGSVSTPDEVERIKKIRDKTQFLITIGACATAGGIQALRNAAQHELWLKSIYASPATVASLKTSTPIAAHVKVDFEVWGCPVSSHQILEVITSLLNSATPIINRDKVCLECKRRGNVCVMVAHQQPCMGPVTHTGCGALCPSLNRACYACYGPAENANTHALGNQLMQQGASSARVAQQFLHINNQAPVFNQAGNYFRGIPIVKA